MFKPSFEQEAYTNHVTCRAHRSVFARLRGGSASLEIERSRYQGVPAEQRICKLCMDEVEDELHFCLKCKTTSAARIPLMKYMKRICPTFETMSTQQQFTKIMSSGGRHVARYIHKLFLLRNKLISS